MAWFRLDDPTGLLVDAALAAAQATQERRRSSSDGAARSSVRWRRECPPEKMQEWRISAIFTNMLRLYLQSNLRSGGAQGPSRGCFADPREGKSAIVAEAPPHRSLRGVRENEREGPCDR